MNPSRRQRTIPANACPTERTIILPETNVTVYLKEPERGREAAAAAAACDVGRVDERQLVGVPLAHVHVPVVHRRRRRAVATISPPGALSDDVHGRRRISTTTETVPPDILHRLSFSATDGSRIYRRSLPLESTQSTIKYRLSPCYDLSTTIANAHGAACGRNKC